MEISFLYTKNDWKSELYRFHLDAFKKEHDAIKGWLVLLDESIELFFEYNTIDGGFKRKRVELLHFRPKLKEIYPEVEGVEFSGFEINVKELKGFKEGHFLILVNDAERKIAKACVKPPLLYVHIAKTAGSTVNKVFLDLFGFENSIVHAESISEWRSRVENDELSYLSGHIPFSIFNKNKKINGFKKAITFREPYSHIVSHLSWIRALSLDENKGRYKAHPEYIQRLSDKMNLCDFHSAEQISVLINSFTPLEYRLLDNTQTRYIRSDVSKQSVDSDDVRSSISNLEAFDFIGTDVDIKGFISEIYNYYGGIYDGEVRENVLSEKFGLNVDDCEIRAALMPLVQYDLELYLYLIDREV